MVGRVVKLGPRTNLSAVVSQAEKDFILEAADRLGHTSLSSFMREVLMEKAASVLQRSFEIGAFEEFVSADDRPLVLFPIGYPAENAPPHERTGMIASLQAFSTLFSDRHLEVLRWVGLTGPVSMHEIAAQFSYPYTSLHRHLTQLRALGILDFGPRTRRACEISLICPRVRLCLRFRSAGPKPGKVLLLTVGDQEQMADVAFDTLHFPTMQYFSRAMTDRGLRLLTVLGKHAPERVAALAKLTDRTPANTYPLINHLDALGLIELSHDYPKSARLAYDEAVLDLALQG